MSAAARTDHGPSTVFVIDDDPSVLRALSRLLRSAEFTVATFASAKAFLDQRNPEAMGCLLLDVSMPEMNGPALQQSLIDGGSMLPIIFLTASTDVPTSVRAMKSGAIDYLTKPCSDEELLDAVAGALALDAKLRSEQSDAQAVAALLAKLTPREREVMLCVVAGQPNKQIALNLGTVEDTIKVHRRRIMQKLQVTSLPDLVRFAEKASKRH